MSYYDPDNDPDGNGISWEKWGIIFILIISLVWVLGVRKSLSEEIWCVDLPNQQMYIEECCDCMVGFTPVHTTPKIILEK